MSPIRLFLSVACFGLCLSGTAFAQADPLAALPSKVSGVIDLPNGSALVLVDSEHGFSNSRTLSVGEVYADGWVLTGVDPAAVTLERAGESRQVRLTGRMGFRTTAPAPAGARIASTESGFAPVSLSNALPPGERPKARNTSNDRRDRDRRRR